MRHFKRFPAYVVCLLIVGLTAIPTGARNGVRNGEWRFYGGDQGSGKYSPLSQINGQNVKDLKVAWTWDSPDLKLTAQNSKLYTLGYEATPLMIGGVLYISTSLSQVAAIDAATGKTVWVYDPKAYESGQPTNLGFVHRVLPTGPTVSRADIHWNQRCLSDRARRQNRPACLELWREREGGPH